MHNAYAIEVNNVVRCAFYIWRGSAHIHSLT